MGAKIVGFITAGVAIALNIFFFQSLIDENNNPESYVYILIGIHLIATISWIYGVVSNKMNLMLPLLVVWGILLLSGLRLLFLLITAPKSSDELRESIRQMAIIVGVPLMLAVLAFYIQVLMYVFTIHVREATYQARSKIPSVEV